MYKRPILFLTGFVFSVWTCTGQFTPTPNPNLQGIAKILDDATVLAKSFKEGNIFTLEYLNQAQPELKGYASFSFEEKGNTAQKIYTLLSKGFQQENPQPLSFSTPQGTIQFEYGMSETRATWLRLAQYGLNNRLEAYSVYLSPEHLRQLFDQ